MKIHDINRISRLRGVPKSQTWAYKPTERQGIFHRHSETYKLFGGAMGGGKSVALCAEAVKLSLKYPGNRGYLCRDQIVDFKRSTLVTFMNLVPKEMLAKHYRDDRLIVLRNGSEILYGGLGGEEDLERIKSTEFGWFVVDEATEVLEEMFVLLCSRLRWRLPDGSHPKYHGLLASNPEPGWVKDRFVDRNLADHIFIRALVTDNPHVPENYVARLRKIFPEEYVKRYIEGSWDVFEGQVYREFDRARHIVDIAEIGRYWERFRVIDHGYRNPTCCLWIAIDHDGAMWVYDEHYRAELTIDEHARIILERHPGFDGLTLADPSMFSRTMQRGGRAWSPADEYRENGIVLMKPYAEDGWMSESTGINLVKQRLRSGSLFVSGECRNTIKELLHYRWKDYKPSVRMKRNTPENPVDKDNHAVDCIRYAVAWRPAASQPPERKTDPDSIHSAIMAHKRQLGLPFYAGWN